MHFDFFGHTSGHRCGCGCGSKVILMMSMMMMVIFSMWDEFGEYSHLDHHHDDDNNDHAVM